MTQPMDAIGESPFARAIVKADLDHLSQLAAVIERYEPSNTDDFAVLIESVLRGRFNQAELAAEFRVSPGTVSRWRAGRSCPPEYARATIVNRIREMIVASANEIKSRSICLAAA